MSTPLATTFKVWSRETATSFAYVPATNTASGVQQPPLHPERLLPVSFNHRKQSIPTFSVAGARVVESGWYYYRRYKKLSRGTARRAMAVEILPAAAQLYEISHFKRLCISHSESSYMARFDRRCITAYEWSVVTVLLSCEILSLLQRTRLFVTLINPLVSTTKLKLYRSHTLSDSQIKYRS